MHINVQGTCGLIQMPLGWSVEASHLAALGIHVRDAGRRADVGRQVRLKEVADGTGPVVAESHIRASGEVHGDSTSRRRQHRMLYSLKAVR